MPVSKKPTYEELEQQVLELREADIKRKQAQKALIESENFLNQSQKISHIGSYVTDLKTGIWRISKEMYSILGIDENYPHTLQGFIEFVHPDSLKEFLAYHHKVESEQLPFDHEYKIIRVNDKSERWVHGLGTIEYDEQSNPVRRVGTIQDITERKQAEEALRESENRLRATLDAAPFPVVIVDSNDDKVYFWSQSAVSLFGHTAPTASEWYQLAYPDPDYRRQIIERWKPFLDIARESGKPVNTGEYRVACKNGSVRICEIYATFLPDNLIVTFNDITERKQAEEALAESEERFRNIAENSLVGVYIIQDGIFIYVNPKFAEIFGYSVEECLNNMHFQQTVHPEDLDVVRELISKRMSGKVNSVNYTFRGIKKNGKIIHVEIFGSSIISNGRPAATGTMLEITERKQAEKELRESQSKFKTIFDLSPQAFALTKLETGELVDVNSKFCELFHHNKEEILGKTSTEVGFFSEQDRKNYRREFEKSGEVNGMEMILKARDGSQISSLTFAKVIQFAGEFFILTALNDKTKEKLLEAELQQARKMEAIGTLAGGIAHDFNNILGIILGNAELAMDDVPEWNPSRQNLDEIRKACLRAKDVVRQILSFSRKSESEQKSFNIASVVTESLKLLRASIPTSIDIRQYISNDVVDILGDPTQFHQIMMNLCTNASHAMENEGGTLEVAVENTTIDADTASRYPELYPGPYVQLRVSDTGDGISPEVIDRIFDPYFTTKDVGKGTGLGLSVVHGIVNSHNGKITVESKPGKGTTFNIWFPAIQREIKDEPKRLKELPTGSETILFVDDEGAMVNLNQQRLERLGYTVIPKTDPSLALDFFRTNPDQIDLIITDMAMPYMTGDKLTQEILNMRPDMPIILCTGYSEKMSEDRAREIGIRKYIEKPIAKETLAMSVREVLDGQ